VTSLILKIVLFLIVLRLIWKFVRGVLEGAGVLQSPTKPSVGLVRDPVCGVFVVPTNALTAGSGLDTRFFCSEKCRSEWRRSKAS
jgi:YHS domain-containing protein